MSSETKEVRNPESRQHVPAMPDPAKDNPDGGEHLPAMPDPTEELPLRIDDPPPRDGEDDPQGVEERRTQPFRYRPFNPAQAYGPEKTLQDSPESARCTAVWRMDFTQTYHRACGPMALANASRCA